MTINSQTRTAQHLALSLRSPDAVIAAVPYLLGFAPSESIVIIWLGKNQIRLTQRVDLPAVDEASTHTKDLAQALVFTARAAMADEGIICIFSDRSNGAELPFTSLITALMVVLHGVRIGVRDALAIQGSPSQIDSSSGCRWWSYLCAVECCPADGRLIDERVALGVQARFALEGVATLPDRAELEHAYDHESAAGVRVALLIDAQVRELTHTLAGIEVNDLTAAADALFKWRTESIDAAVGLVLRADATDPISDLEAACLVFCLNDIRVRDTLLWHVAQRADRHAALDVLATALRRAPVGMIAPIATCTAICAWLTGDGARALVALERGHTDNPEYSLAQLVSQGLLAGLPPTSWLEAMGDLTEQQCRTGDRFTSGSIR